MAVKMLIDAKADVNRDVDGKNTLLQYAMGVSSGCVALVAGEPIDVRISIINLLLTAGAKTRGLRDGFTALTLCCDSEAPMWLLEPVIRALVSHDRTLLDEVDENGWTPVTMAVSKTNAPVVKLLLDMGAGVDKKPSKHTRSQLPVLFHLRHMFGYCFPCESARSILCMLLDAGADPMECDDDGRTVFMNIWEKMRRDNLRRMNIPRSDRFIHDYVADILIVDIINHILSVPSRSVARQD
jgi:ankyrin repeat protein